MKYAAKKWNPALLGRSAIEVGLTEMVSGVQDQIAVELQHFKYKQGDCDEL